MTMLVRGGAAGAGSALPTGATTGQVLQWNGSAWVAATPSASGTTPNATPTVPGLVQLTGDLGGTATAPTVPGLAAKANSSSLAPVATSGSYGDLTARPLLALVATSGSYGDLTGRPVIPAAPTYRVKAAATGQTSTTTLTLDPDLSATLAPGTYLFDLIAVGAASGGGLDVQLGGSATFTTLRGLYCAGNTWAGWDGTSRMNPVPAGGNYSGSNFSARLIVLVTGAGTVGLQWAQNTSNAAASTVIAGSALLLTKLA